ncbi:hypothetical protein COB64_00075 [Candidatus Wolfebacteria bacterium]|nr:MAG: hypothetical protein COB64_00075 [Candidatus Wolfebacteria bacterium]
MTKYIIVGGYASKTEDGGKGYCEELIEGFEEPIKILDTMFARPKENWDETLEKDKNFFEQCLPGKKLEIQPADPKRFIEQVKWANVISLRGGEDEPLLEQLKSNKGWEELLDGKTLAGSSAGAHAISKYYYQLDGSNKFSEGLGLLPVKVIVHYRSDYNASNIDWDDADREAKNYKEDIETVPLREGEFKVFKI